MKVLFVSSSNSKANGISIIVKLQGESLQKAGIELDYFTIKGRGVSGYIANVFALRKKLKIKKYDLIHAHYSLSGFCATLAGAKPLIVSLMGSDVLAKNKFSRYIEFCSKFYWDATIVKSRVMNEKIELTNLYVVPNGVDLSRFNPMDFNEVKTEIGLERNKKYVIFVSNPERYEKNFLLAEKAVLALNDESVELLPVYNSDHQDVVKYMYAADVLILTSFWEGSPNVIKEAMACNCPIVSVDIGDVRDVIEGVEGCFIAERNAEDIAEKLKLVFERNKRTNGREKLMNMGLDSESVAQKIIEIYKNVLS